MGFLGVRDIDHHLMVKSVLSFHFLAYFSGRLTFTSFNDHAKILRVEHAAFLGLHERFQLIGTYGHIGENGFAIGIFTAHQKNAYGFLGNNLLGGGEFTQKVAPY